MSDDTVTIWGIGTTRTMRPYWLLHELGRAYRAKPIGSRTGETHTPEYMALNPKQKIPTLQHGDLVLSESAAIVHYLAERYPAPESIMAPADARGRARIAEWCFFVMTELDAHSLYVIRRHRGLKHIYGEAPVAVAAAEEYFLKQLSAMADRVPARAGCLFGPVLSTADILLTTCLDWARLYGIALPAPLPAYQARMHARPAYRAAFARNYPDREIAEMS